MRRSDETKKCRSFVLARSESPSGCAPSTALRERHTFKLALVRVPADFFLDLWSDNLNVIAMEEVYPKNMCPSGLAHFRRKLEDQKSC
jgi:hypothetical protein